MTMEALIWRYSQDLLRSSNDSTSIHTYIYIYIYITYVYRCTHPTCDGTIAHLILVSTWIMIILSNCQDTDHFPRLEVGLLRTLALAQPEQGPEVPQGQADSSFPATHRGIGGYWWVFVEGKIPSMDDVCRGTPILGNL